MIYSQGLMIYTPARDEIQGRQAALDDIHHSSRGDDIPSLRLGYKNKWDRDAIPFVFMAERERFELSERY